MIIDALAAIDITHAWWQPLRTWLPGGQRWEQALPGVADRKESALPLADTPAIPVADLLNALAPPGFSMRFVSQSSLPTQMAYEQYIYETGQCPTRDNLHDFFNGLCWFRFPQTKTIFNRIQAAQIRRQGVGQRRGIIRDTITLLDEGGLFLSAPKPLWDAITQRDWQRAFIQERGLWQHTHTAIIGHALLEKCVTPYRAITANVIAIPPDHPLDEMDSIMARELERILDKPHLQVKPHHPLPVMGIPGWDPASEDPAFYSDLTVFRPPRPQSSTR